MPTVNHVSIFDASADRAWAVLRRFGAIADWHKAIAASKIEDEQPESQPGSIRNLTLGDGAVLRERLLALDDAGRTLTYKFLTAPLPVDNYHLTVQVLPVSGKDQAVLNWTARFDVQQGNDVEAMTDLMSGLIVGGDEALHGYLRDGRDG